MKKNIFDFIAGSAITLAVVAAVFFDGWREAVYGTGLIVAGILWGAHLIKTIKGGKDDHQDR